MATIAPVAATTTASDRPDLFVSYAREDKAFVAGRLQPALVAAHKDAWIDLEDIPPAADWRKRIDDGIEASRAYVFVLSPDSVASEVCGYELRRAIEGNKRLIPVLRRDVDGTDLPAELTRPNWILLRDEDDFAAQMKRLLDALDIDFEWVDMHARLAVRAREWQRAGQDRSLLLRGSDLVAAERWLGRQGGHAEVPTAEHSSYIVASRHAATNSQRRILGSVTVALLIAIGLAIFAVFQAREAREQRAQAETQRAQAQRQRDRALSLALAANSRDSVGVDPEKSLLLAIEAEKRDGTDEADDALRGALRAIRWRRLIRPGGVVVAADVGGNRVVTAGGKTATIWEAGSGRRLRELRGHRAPIVSAQLSGDGRRVVTTAVDGDARIWDAATGRTLVEIPGRDDRVRGDGFEPVADFAARDRFVYVPGRSVTRLWDVERGRVAAALRVPGGSGRLDVDVSADGTRVATTRSLAKATQVWDLATGSMIQTLHGTGDVARFSPDGRRIATAGGIWDVVSGRRLHRLRGDVDSVAFRPDGKRIAAIHEDDVYIYGSRGELAARLPSHDEDVTTAEFSPDGTRVLTASVDGDARVWDPATGRNVDVLRGHRRALVGAEYSRDGRAILTLGEDNTVRLWDTDRDVLEIRSPATAEVSPDGRFLVSPDGRPLAVRDAAGGALVATLRGDAFDVAAFSPRGGVLATAGGPRVWLWSTKTWAPVTTLVAGDRVRTLAFSRDGRRVVATSDSGVTVWDVASGRRIGAIDDQDVSAAVFGIDSDEVVGVWEDVDGLGSPRWSVGSWTLPNGPAWRVWHADGERPLLAVEPSPDGRLVLTSGPDGALVLDARTGKLAAAIGADVRLNSAHFGPDGRHVVTSDDDDLARIWAARTGARVRDLSGHTGAVHDARLSPDGRFAVTIASDGTSRIWDAATGSTMQVLRGVVDGAVQQARFSPDGARVITADGASLRVSPCRLCVPIERQLEFAKGLVGRALTADERREAGLS